MKQNQAEQGEVLQENIPAEDLEEGEESKMSVFFLKKRFSNWKEFKILVKLI